MTRKELYRDAYRATMALSDALYELSELEPEDIAPPGRNEPHDTDRPPAPELKPLTDEQHDELERRRKGPFVSHEEVCARFEARTGLKVEGEDSLQDLHVLSALENVSEPLTFGELCKALAIDAEDEADKKALRLVLETLLDEGKIAKEGVRRGTRYRVASVVVAAE